MLIPAQLRGQDAVPQDLQAERKQPTETYLGIIVGKVDPALASHLENLLQGQPGLLVTSVLPKSPADRAGIRRHDVLFRFNGTALTSRDQLKHLTLNCQPRAEVTLELIRSGRSRKTTLKVGSRLIPEVAKAVSAALPQIPAGIQQRSVRISVRENGQADVHIMTVKSDGRKSDHQFSGSKEDVLLQIEKALPSNHKRIAGVMDSLGRNSPPKGVRFRCFPIMAGKNRLGLRVHMQHRSCLKTQTILEMELAINNDDSFQKMLKGTLLEQELQKLKPDVRTLIKGHLSKQRVPAIRFGSSRSQ